MTTEMDLPTGGERRCCRGDDGFTVTELIVAMGLIVLLSLIAFSAVNSMLAVASPATGQGQANEKVTLLMNELRQEIISATIVYPPNASQAALANAPTATSPIAGFALLVLTQLNGINTCVQWRVVASSTAGSYSVQTRNFAPNYTAGKHVGPWSTLITNLQNAANTNTAPFTLSPGSTYSSPGSVVALNLVVGGNNAPGGPVSVQSVVAARNAFFYTASSYYSGSATCSSVPAP